MNLKEYPKDHLRKYLRDSFIRLIFSISCLSFFVYRLLLGYTHWLYPVVCAVSLHSIVSNAITIIKIRYERLVLLQNVYLESHGECLSGNFPISVLGRRQIYIFFEADRNYIDGFLSLVSNSQPDVEVTRIRVSPGLRKYLTRGINESPIRFKAEDNASEGLVVRVHLYLLSDDPFFRGHPFLNRISVYVSLH